MLGDWASLLVYLLFAALIAGSLLFASVVLGTRGRREGRQKSYSFESGVSTGALPAVATSRSPTT